MFLQSETDKEQLVGSERGPGWNMLVVPKHDSLANLCDMSPATRRTRGETQKCNEENADLKNEFETEAAGIRVGQRACDEGTRRPAGHHHSEQRR